MSYFHLEEYILFFSHSMRKINYGAFPISKIILLLKRGEILQHDKAGRNQLIKFLKSVPEFNLTYTDIAAFKTVIKQVAAEREESLIDQLQKLQRVYQISPTPQAISKLIKFDLTSAYKIVNLSEEEFVQKYGGDLGTDEATITHKRASLLIDNCKETMK